MNIDINNIVDQVKTDVSGKWVSLEEVIRIITLMANQMKVK